MNIRTLSLISAIGLGLSSISVLTAQVLVRQQAPTDRAADFPLARER